MAQRPPPSWPPPSPASALGPGASPAWTSAPGPLAGPGPAGSAPAGAAMQRWPPGPPPAGPPPAARPPFANAASPIGMPPPPPAPLGPPAAPPPSSLHPSYQTVQPTPGQLPRFPGSGPPYAPGPPPTAPPPASAPVPPQVAFGGPVRPGFPSPYPNGPSSYPYGTYAGIAPGGPPTAGPPPSGAGQLQSGPPSWQSRPAGRVYPDAYGGQPSGPPSAFPTQTVAPLPSGPMSQFPGVMPSPAPGLSQPGSPAGGTPSSINSRIDPNQIPRPQPFTTSVYFETRVNGQANLPPSATSTFCVRDTGNCSPRIMRSTLNQIPCSSDLLANSGMPLAIIVQPLALPHPSEEPIQVVDFGESGPVRCSRCKAYINPFMKFIDQGRRFTCSLCGFINDTPRDYVCNLGPDGRRRDAEDRPELSRGSVEFLASKEYMVRDPMPAVFFFLVDVSMNAVQTGATAAACSAIHRALEDMQDGPGTRVGIATFDTTIHFYNLSKALQQPAMLVVPDIQDVYTPLHTDLVVPLFECREHLQQLLDTLPGMFQDSRIPESAFGAAIKGAYLALKSTGGKLLVFQSVLPSVGMAALTARELEGKALSGNEKEAHKLLLPADKILKTMAVEFAEFQVCVDLFLTTQLYVDVASLAVVPRTTGGQIYYYPQFNASVDSAKLYNDLRWNLTRPQGLEAVMRVRCSQGLQVQEYYGNFCRRTVTDVDLPAIDSDKAIMVTFKHDEKLPEDSECCFQCALLYTTISGERRIRVNTLSLPTTAVLVHLFRGADLDAQFTYFLKMAGNDALAISLSQVKEKVAEQCVSILYTYRKFCASASSSGQLILPEALKLLPLYTLALTKSTGLRSDVRIDERSYWIARAASISASLTVPLVYPRMFSIHDLPPKDGAAVLPPPVPLSSDNLDNDSIFLLETGEDALILVGKAASRDSLHELFGVQSVDDIVPGPFLLQEYDNAASRRLNEVVNEIRRQRCSYLRLRLLKRGDPSEMLFFSFLVEDKSQEISYVEFLVRVHKQIQVKMKP